MAIGGSSGNHVDTIGPILGGTVSTATTSTPVSTAVIHAWNRFTTTAPFPPKAPVSSDGREESRVMVIEPPGHPRASEYWVPPDQTEEGTVTG